MKVSSDYVDLLRALNNEQARFMIVGAYAVAHHAEPRYTKDIDLWVEPTPANAPRVFKALAAFGAPLEALAVTDLQERGVVFQIGVEPVRADILTSIGNIDFGQAYARSIVTTFGGQAVRVLGLDDLIDAKEQANRPQDRLDLKKLRMSKKR